MIFPPNQCVLILEGRKTQARLPIQRGETLTDGCLRGRRGRARLRVGRTYAVQPARNKGAIWYRRRNGRIDTRLEGDAGWDADTLTEKGYTAARIRVLDIQRGHLHDVADDDLQREGCTSLQEFRQRWDNSRYTHPWRNNPPVWIVSFELVE